MPEGKSTTQPVTALMAMNRTRWIVFLAVIAAALLAPIWTVRYPPSVDYPNHLASGFVLAHLKDPAFHFRQFYGADWRPYPYFAMDVILLGLQRFVSIDLAGRLLLSLGALCAPGAAWFFIHRANPGEEGLAFWALVASTTSMNFLLYGMVNVQLAFALCLALLGWWLGFLGNPRRASWFLLLVATTCLYFTHLFGFIVAGLVMTAYILLARQRFRGMLVTWALFVPGVILYLYAMWGIRTPHAMRFRGLTNKLFGLAALFKTGPPALDVLTLLVVLACLVWALAGNPEFRWNRRWLGVTGLLLLLYMLLPVTYGDIAIVDKRLLIFVFVFGLAAVKVGRRGRAVAVAAFLLFLIRSSAVERYSLSLQPHLSELSRSFESIPPGARVLPLVDWMSTATPAERHFWAYGVIERGWYSPCLFHIPGVQPFALKLQAYAPCNILLTTTTLEWDRVQNEFDYVWAFREPQFTDALSHIGVPVFEGEGLKVFRMRNAVLQSPR